MKFPLTAMSALSDLLVYDAQLLSLFPWSAAHYPEDSVTHLRQARAAAWIDRLRELATQRNAGVAGWQCVPFAKVAVRAGNDSMAKRLLDERLAEVDTSPAERAYVLAEAVTVFTTRTDDSLRMRRNLELADRYAAQFRTVPSIGFPRRYRARNDSAMVLYWQLQAYDSLIVADDAFGTSKRLLAHAQSLLALAPRFAPDERLNVLGWLYRFTVNAALDAIPVNAAEREARRHRAIDILDKRFIAVAGMVTSDEMHNVSPEIREKRGAAFASTMREMIRDVANSRALTGTVAPAVIAHAWLNMPDALYRADPRAHAFTGGRFYVLLFSNLFDERHLPILDRMQGWFPGRLDALLVTSTSGHTLYDLVAPDSEVMWLTSYYVGLRHFSMPIAIWAGAKKPVPAMVSGATAALPVPTPIDTTVYRYRDANFVILDSHGRFRDAVNVETRAEEELLRRRLAKMLDSVTTVPTFSSDSASGSFLATRPRVSQDHSPIRSFRVDLSL